MLISAEYQAEQERLHSTYDSYGMASVLYADAISQVIRSAQVTQLLDYGCGKARLVSALDPTLSVSVSLYDPGIPRYAAPPQPSEMVTCIDVLEHIEPELLDNVLDDLARLTLFIGFFTVNTGPAVKVLSDGRNAHLIQEPMAWWLPKFEARFDILDVREQKNEVILMVLRKNTLALAEQGRTVA